MILERDIKPDLLVPCAKKRGFSLMESAIVLGIMGIVLGALWGVVSIVHEGIKQQQMIDQMILMVNNIRDHYLSRSRVVGTAGLSTFADVTPYLIESGVMPVEQIRNRTAVPLRADHPWGPTGAAGGLLTSGGLGGIGVDGGADPTEFFRIQLRGLAQASCIALTDKLTGSNMPLGLTSVTINATAYASFPVSPDQALASCVAPAGDGNLMTFTYRLRPQFAP